MAADLLLQTPAPADSQLLFAPEELETPPGPNDLLFEGLAPAGHDLLFGATAGEALIDGSIEQATGGKTTQFGAPAATAGSAAEPQAGAAAGSTTTAFGTPGSTAGTPDAAQTQATGFIVTVLGDATACCTQPAAGSSTTQLGTPSSAAGTPDAAQTQAAGFVAAALGAGTVRCAQPAVGSSTTQLGAPSSAASASIVSSFSSTAWGQAASGRVQPAAGSMHTAFGVGVAVSDQACAASGFVASVFGAATSPPQAPWAFERAALVSGNPFGSSALTAYDAWVSQHAATTQVSYFDEDDSVKTLDLGFAPIPWSPEHRVFVSGESALGFYTAPLPSIGSTVALMSCSTPQGTVSRMYSRIDPPPAELFAVRPYSLDAGTQNSKWAKSTDVAILYYKTGLWSNPVSTEVAIRITPGRVDLVVTTAQAQQQKLMRFTFEPALNATVSEAGEEIYDLGTVGTRTFTALAIAASATVCGASGSSPTQFGLPAGPAPQLAGATGLSSTAYGVPVWRDTSYVASPLGSPASAPLLAYDDFSSDVWPRPQLSVTGTVSGGLLNPTTYGWRDDVTRIIPYWDNPLRTEGIFFDMTLVVEARDSGPDTQGIEVILDQGSGANDYGLHVIADRSNSGIAHTRLVAMDSVDAGTKYGEFYSDTVRRCFPAGGRHTYRLVSRPGFYELFEDGVLLAGIATDAEKQARPFSMRAEVDTYSLAVDSFRLVEYGATGPGPLAQFGAPMFGQTGVAQGIQATTSGAHHSGGTYHPEGEVATRFGLADVDKNAVGFKPAVVPIPSVPLLVAGIASTLHLGAPDYIAHRATGLGPVAVVPLAYRQFDHWGRALPLAGETSFGNTWSYTRMPQRARVWAAGIAPAPFGVPAATVELGVGADGFSTTALGSPVARLRLAATSTPAAATFGGPTATIKASASAGRTTAFGRPTSAQAIPAQAVYRPTRFGRPKAGILGTCKARGFTTVRLARPGCRTGNFRLATALVAPARFGAASATNTNRALHIAPIVRFGRSLRSRRTTC